MVLVMSSLLSRIYSLFFFYVEVTPFVYAIRTWEPSADLVVRALCFMCSHDVWVYIYVLCIFLPHRERASGFRAWIYRRTTEIRGLIVFIYVRSWPATIECGLRTGLRGSAREFEGFALFANRGWCFFDFGIQPVGAAQWILARGSWEAFMQIHYTIRLSISRLNDPHILAFSRGGLVCIEKKQNIAITRDTYILAVIFPPNNYKTTFFYIVYHNIE